MIKIKHINGFKAFLIRKRMSKIPRKLYGVAGKASKKTLPNGDIRLTFNLWNRGRDPCAEKLVFPREPRFNFVCPSDTIVFASGELVVDTQTGIWRRYNYYLKERAYGLCSTLNFCDEEHKKLTAALEEPEWPKNLRQRLRHADYLLNNWYKLPRIP